ncbi:hypothetical protein EV126DRAFT_74034 [Verticillium dahliae]|nr:hypothetical protein EV126DRAFT_74034 [Verticillium dahliae]
MDQRSLHRAGREQFFEPVPVPNHIHIHIIHICIPTRTLSTLSSSLTASSSVLTSASSATLASSVGAPSTLSTSTTPTPTPAATTAGATPSRPLQTLCLSFPHLSPSLRAQLQPSVGKAVTPSQDHRRTRRSCQSVMPPRLLLHKRPVLLPRIPSEALVRLSVVAAAIPTSLSKPGSTRIFASDIAQKSPNPDLDVTRSGLGYPPRLRRSSPIGPSRRDRPSPTPTLSAPPYHQCILLPLPAASLRALLHLPLDPRRVPP